MSTSHEGGNRGEEGTSSETETREGAKRTIYPHEFEVRRRHAAGTRREARRGERRALFGAPSMPSRRRGNARGLRERAAGTFPACIEPPEPRANALSPPATPRRRRTLEMWLALRNRRVKLHLHSGCAHPARLVPGERSPRRVHLRVRPAPPERTEPSRHGKRKAHREQRPCLTDFRAFPSSLRSVRASGSFQTIDAKHENLVISDLDSGAGTIPVALVRWSDVLSMTTDGAEGPSATLSG